MSTNQFDDQWNALIAGRQHDSFDYAGSSEPFDQVVTEHFRARAPHTSFGVYVVRQQSSNEVLYVGMSGFINNQGQFKGKQDIPDRLKNVKTNDVPANVWFGSLVQERGSLSVQYLLLDNTPISPSLAEATLLQAYLNENGRLPNRNKEL